MPPHLAFIHKVKPVCGVFFYVDDIIQTLFTVKIKKEPAALLPKFTEVSATPTDSKIRISDFLNIVNKLYLEI